jgi:hypothetical protein
MAYSAEASEIVKSIAGSDSFSPSQWLEFQDGCTNGSALTTAFNPERARKEALAFGLGLVVAWESALH